MSKRALPLFAVLLLGGAIGFGTARLWPTRSSTGDSPPIAAEDARDRASAILGNPDPIQRLVDVTELIGSAGPEARPGFVEAVEESALDGGEPEVVVLGLWWARFDPDGALRWTQNEWRARFGSVIAAVYRGWAQHAPEPALAQAQKVYFRVQRMLAVEAALAGWDESGRAGLSEAAAPLVLGAESWVGDVLARRRVGALGPEGAVRWLESIENGELREAMVGPVAEAGAAIEGGAPVVARWAEPRITGVDHRTGLPHRIGTQWVRYDPEAAFAWLEALPAGVDRDDGVGGAFGAWMARDGSAAFAWAEHTPLERWNEPAMAVYARSMVVYGGASKALATAARFSNPDLRDTTTINLVLAWLGHDRAAALAWLADANLSESVLTKVNEMVAVRRGGHDAAGGSAKDDAAAAARPRPAS
jgi:hypothetical protein